MLKRSLGLVRLGRQVLATTQKRQPWRLSFATERRCATAVAASNSSSQNDSLDDIVDVICTENPTQQPPNIRRPVFGEKVTAFSELQEDFCTAPPKNAKEIVNALHLCVRFNQRNREALLAWINSKEVIETLSTRLLHPAVALRQTIAAVSALIKIKGSASELQSTDITEPESVPNFDELISALLHRVECTTDEYVEVELNVLLDLYYRVAQNNLSLSENVISTLKNNILQRVQELTSSEVITLLASLNASPTASVSHLDYNKVFTHLEDILPTMLVGEAIHVVTCIAEKDLRNIPFLKRLYEYLRSQPLTHQQLVKLANATTQIRMPHPRLFRRLANDFADKMHDTNEWSAITTCANFLARSRISHSHAWMTLIQWMCRNIESADMANLQRCVGACAVNNVCQEYIRPVTNELVARLTPRHVGTPLAWLRLVHSLAVLEALTPHIAETCLSEEFKKALFQQKTDPQINENHSYYYQRLMQISAAAKHDLEGYSGPVVDSMPKELEPYVPKLKYGAPTPMRRLVDDFNDAIHQSVLSRDHVRPASLNPDGIWIDAVVHTDQSGKSIRAKDARKDTRKLAVLFLESKHCTIPDTGATDEEPIRILGEFQMNVRHLQRCGYTPVVITKYELEMHSDMLSKIRYMKQRLQNPTDAHLAAPSW